MPEEPFGPNQNIQYKNIKYKLNAKLSRFTMEPSIYRFSSLLEVPVTLW